MLNIKRKLGNTREASANANPELAVATTKGVVKLTWPICERIKAPADAYVGIVESEEGDFYLYVGSKDDNNQDGNKLTSVTGKEFGGSTMQFSSALTWKSLGGNPDCSMVYGVAEEAVESEGVDYWALSFEGEREKQERKASEENATTEEVEELED